MKGLLTCWIIFIVFGYLLGSEGVKVRYDNYQVWSIKIENDRQLKVLQEIELKPNGYQLWGSPGHVGQFLELVVPPHKTADFEQILLSFGFKNKLINKNLQELIDNEQSGSTVRSSKFGWEQYHTLQEINQWLDEVVKSNKNVVKPIELGYSWEGRAMKGVHISYGGASNKPTIFIESNIHAREWITSATTTWLINELLTSADAEVRSIAESIDWYIFPVVNPDGFEYTHTTNRMWRKTRSDHHGSSSCIGVDGNRNFNFSWMQGGASQEPCSDTYAGPYPFSEMETTAIANFFETVKDRVELYLSFHSYGQLLMYPYAHSQDPISNKAEHIQVSDAAGRALQELYGTKYKVGNAQTVLYTTSGGSRDWAKGEKHVPFSFTYEMRDTGNYGFLLPSNQIIPNSKEILRSLLYLIKEAKKLGYFSV